MTILPTFIMPLFNKYEPLPDGSLKDQINSLADKIKFPLTKLFVVDGSKRSGHSNAYMFGFRNNKRIVLYDTLISQVTEEELCAILGHELGASECTPRTHFHWLCLTNSMIRRTLGSRAHGIQLLLYPSILWGGFFLLLSVLRQRWSCACIWLQ